MNRRDFLAFSAALGVAVILPEGLDESDVEVSNRQAEAFDPAREYGRQFEFRSRDLTKSVVDKATELLAKDARETLPPGLLFEIRRQISSYDMVTGLAWYYSPRLATDNRRPVGYQLLGRFTA